jgi:hypothetical protein
MRDDATRMVTAMVAGAPDATVKRMRLPRRTALPARQCPSELAYRRLMLLVPDFGKVVGNLKLHTLVQREKGFRGCDL